MFRPGYKKNGEGFAPRVSTTIVIPSLVRWNERKWIRQKKNYFKKFRPVPKESDFVNAILSLGFHKPPAPTCRDTSNPIGGSIRRNYSVRVSLAEVCLTNKLAKVMHTFSCLSVFDHLYTQLLNLRYDVGQYHTACYQLRDAIDLIRDISSQYTDLLEKDDCDSLDKCKLLKVTALARMFTVVKRCVPSLEFLDKCRVYMASLPKDFEDVKKEESSLWNMYDVGKREWLPDNYWMYLFDDVADAVDPETFSWFEDLEREYGVRLIGDDELACQRLAQTHLTHLPLSA